MKRLFILIGIIGFITACEELDPGKPGMLVPKTVDEDASLPSIEVNNTRLHAEAFGINTNPMIVVMHGGPGEDYRSLLNCQELADHGYYVVFYDQRGTGLSKREDKSKFSMQVMLDDLTGVINHYRTSSGQKIILLGQSWGAMLASAYIDKYPTAIAGAMLCEPGGLVWDDVVDYMGRSRDYGITNEATGDATYIDQFITGKEADHEMLDYKFGIASSTGSSKDSPLGDEGPIPFWRKGAIANRALTEMGEDTEPNWTKYLHLFDTKVLFLYSENNKAYGLAHAQHVSSAYPNVQVERIDDAGHEMLTFENGWNNFLPLALNYLNELGL
jgi:proline iminopeptidase